MDTPTAGSLTKFQKIVALLLQHNIAYRACFKSSCFLVHPQNRGGIGINIHNSHKTMSTVKTIGGAKSELRHAVAIEMCPLKDKREMQIAFNHKLVDEAGGQMAPITGEERFLTISCSHWTQGCRGVEAGCKTNVVELQDSSGCLNKIMYIGNDNELRDIFENGWEWLIVPWSIEQVAPGFANLAQNALNAQQQTVNQATELEIAHTLYLLAEEHANDYDATVEATLQSAPPCAKYIHIVKEYAQFYSGGKGAPILKYLASFSKHHGESKALGETFMSAVVELKFSTVSSKFPYLRSAMIATNLATDKVIDGIARLVVPNDVNMLKAKDKLVQVLAAETLLEECWNHLEKATAQGEVSDHAACNLFGKTSSGIVLFLLKKASKVLRGKTSDPCLRSKRISAKILLHALSHHRL